MAEAIINIRRVLDTVRSNRNIDIISVNGDYGARFINAVIAVDGKPVKIDPECAVTINARRIDKASKAFVGTANEDGTVTVPITEWMLEIPHSQVTATVTIAGAGSKLSVTEFTISVQDTPHKSEEITEDDPNYDVLLQVLAGEASRNAAENNRQTNENERISAERERAAKDAARDPKIAEIENKVGIAYDYAFGANNLSELAVGTANEADQVAKAARTESTEAKAQAVIAKDQSDVTRTSLINLSAQVQGIGRTYVIPTFLEFIDFLRNTYKVMLREDRDGDGEDEAYEVHISDLKSGDNIIITEKGVPDFWLEKNAALTEFETYTYNGIEYPLGAIVGGVVIGGAHILETDYSVIEGHAISAAASAHQAQVAELGAIEAKNEAEAAAIAAKKSAEEAKVGKLFANALKGKKSGGAVAMSDISPLEHPLDVRVRSKNLIPYPYANSTVERYGITYTDHGDGTVTANGTATQQSWFLLYREVLQPGDYFFKGTPQNAAAYVYVANSDYTLYKTDRGAGVAFSIATETLISISINVESGKTVVNELYKPMLTIGAVATDEHTPYIPDISAVKVKKLGKNLSIVNEFELNGKSTTTLLYKGHITEALVLSWKQDVASTNGASLFGVKKANVYEWIQNIGDGKTAGEHSVVIKPVNEEIEIQILNWGSIVGNLTDIQLEVNPISTDFEPYIEPVEYAVTADGSVEGVLPIYPTTTLITDTSGAVIDVEYNRNINKAFEELYNAIISLGGNI